MNTVNSLPASRQKAIHAAPLLEADLRLRAEERLYGKKFPAAARPPTNEEDARRLLHELQVHQVELELQNEELHRARDTMEEARDQYRDLYDRAPAGYLTLDGKGIIRQANQTMARMISTERGSLLEQSLYRFVEQEQRGALLRHFNWVAETDAQQNLQTVLLKKDGGDFSVQMEISPLSLEDGGRGFRVVLVDISRLKAAEGQLRRSNERLEEEVRKRTAELIATNKDLEEANIALRVMLHRVEGEREIIEGNIMEQVHRLLVPCLLQVLAGRLEPGQRLGIDTALSHLDRITSAFAKKLGSPDLGLTPRELQITGMINSGLRSKEIADSLNMSPDTVSFHRRNIRRKLGITASNTGLSTHLRKFA